MKTFMVSILAVLLITAVQVYGGDVIDATFGLSQASFGATNGDCPSSSLQIVNDVVHDLHFDIPDINFSNDSVTVHLTKVHLSDICLGGVDISDKSTTSSHSLFATATGVDAVVTADFFIKATILKIIPIKTSGHATITVKDTQMTFGVKAPTDSYHLPTALNAVPGATGCTTDLANKISIELTPKSEIIEELSKVATSIFGGMINNKLCSALRDTVSSELSPVVSKLYAGAKPYRPTPPPPIRPTVPKVSGLLDWGSEKVVQSTAKLTSSIPSLLANLAEKSKGSDGFSQLVTSGMGLSIPVKSPVVNALFTLDAIAARGIDADAVFAPLSSGDRSPSRELWSSFEQHGPLTVRFNVSVELTNPQTGKRVGPLLKPVVALQLDLRKMWAKSVIPFKNRQFSALPLAQLPQPKCLSKCVIEPFRMYDVGIKLGWAKDTIKFSGLSPGVNKLASQALQAINTIGAPFITTILPHAISLEVPSHVNQFIKSFISPSEEDKCIPPSPDHEYIVWGDEKLFATGSKLLNENLLPKLNEYVDKAFPSGHLHVESPLMKASVKGFNISVPSLDIQGLDSFGTVEVLGVVPEQPFTLRNKFGIGSRNSARGEFTMTTELQVESHNTFKNQDLSHNDVVASFSVKDFTIDLDVLLKIDRNEILNWKLEYFLMLETRQPCFLAPIHEAQITKLDIHLEAILVDLHCKSCSATELQELSRSLDTALAKKLLSIAITKRIQEALPLVQENGKKAVNYALSHFLQEVFDECHHNATAPPTPTLPPASSDGFGIGAAVGLGAGLVATVSILVVCFATPGNGTLRASWNSQSVNNITSTSNTNEDMAYHILQEDGVEHQEGDNVVLDTEQGGNV